MVVNVYNRYLFLYMKKSTAGTWLAVDLSLRLFLNYLTMKLWISVFGIEMKYTPAGIAITSLSSL